MSFHIKFLAIKLTPKETFMDVFYLLYPAPYTHIFFLLCGSSWLFNEAFKLWATPSLAIFNFFPLLCSPSAKLEYTLKLERRLWLSK